MSGADGGRVTRSRFHEETPLYTLKDQLGRRLKGWSPLCSSMDGAGGDSRFPLLLHALLGLWQVFSLAVALGGRFFQTWPLEGSTEPNASNPHPRALLVLLCADRCLQFKQSSPRPIRWPLDLAGRVLLDTFFRLD